MPRDLASAFALGIAAERRRQAVAREATLARLAQVEAWATAEIGRLRAEAQQDRQRFMTELHRAMMISDSAVAERPALLN
jgi:regulator of protease activity HflC (stomatin/prohibitin superfamily)